MYGCNIDRHPDRKEVYFRMQIKGNQKSSPVSLRFNTHAQCEQGKVVSVGVHIMYIYLWTKFFYFIVQR